MQPSLDLLREIQRTGDIFFPSRWMDATLWDRWRTSAAAVRAFLTRERDYPKRLRWTILSAADELFRVAPSAAGPQAGGSTVTCRSPTRR